MSHQLEPNALSFNSGGWHPHHVVWDESVGGFFCGDGVRPARERSNSGLFVAKLSREEQEHNIVRPSDDDWEAFWYLLDQIGVWDWHGNHTIAKRSDDDDWNLAISFGGRELRAVGTYSQKRPTFFKLFVRTLNALVGFPRLSIKSEWQHRDVVEDLTDLFKLAKAVHAIRNGSNESAKILIECIEAKCHVGEVLAPLPIEVGSLREQVLPALLDHLKGRDESTFWNIVAIGTFGAQAESALPILLDLVESPHIGNEAFFRVATQGIVSIGADSRLVAKRLPALLDSDSWGVRSYGVKIASGCHNLNEETMATLARRFENSESARCVEATRAVTDIFVEPKELLTFLQRPWQESTLIQYCLSHTNSFVKQQAALWIAKIGHLARYLVPEVLPLLQDSDYTVRHAAVEAICQIAVPQEAVALSIDLLDDVESYVRQNAMIQLGALGRNAKPALPKLMTIIVRGVDSEYSIALDAILQIVSEPSDLFSEFKMLLKDSRAEARQAGVSGLRRLGGDSYEVIQLIVDTCDDPEKSVREASIQSLRDLHGETAKLALPALCRALKEEGTCGSAADVISTFREDAVDAIPDLLDVLISSETEGADAYCVSRTLYELSAEFAEGLPPEVVSKITLFGANPIWHIDDQEE